MIKLPPGESAVQLDEDGSINALNYHGVKLMSYGWVAPPNKHGERNGGAVLRGPVVSKVKRATPPTRRRGSGRWSACGVVLWFAY